jgi:hypothetical protein
VRVVCAVHGHAICLIPREQIGISRQECTIHGSD